jgi:hypothetical protein
MAGGRKNPLQGPLVSLEPLQNSGSADFHGRQDQTQAYLGRLTKGEVSRYDETIFEWIYFIGFRERWVSCWFCFCAPRLTDSFFAVIPVSADLIPD